MSGRGQQLYPMPANQGWRPYPNNWGPPQPQQRGGSGPTRFNELPVPDDGKEYVDDWFINLATWGNGSFTPLQTQTAVIQIQQDSYFELIEITQFGNLHGATPPFSDNILLPIAVQLTDTGSNRSLFSAPTPISMFAGNGKQPFILPISRMFQPLATITLNATNIDAANTYDNVYLALIGRKIYDVTPPPGVMRR